MNLNTNAVVGVGGNKEENVGKVNKSKNETEP